MNQPELQTMKPGDRPYKTIVTYGPTGSGKSWFAASGESELGGRTLVVMTEGAEGGLTGFDVDVAQAHTMDEYRDILRFLKNGTHKYKVAVTDSLSQLQKFGLAADAENEFKKGNTKTPLNTPLDAYKRVGEDIRRSMWIARTLPLHWVYICLDRLFTSDDGTVQMIGPNLTESLSMDVRAYADVVGYLTAELLDVQGADGKVAQKLVRRLFLQPGKNFHARVRAGKGVEVPPYIVSPTLPKLLKLLGVN